MSGSLIGALRVTLGIDTAAFEEGLTIAQKRLAGAGKAMQAVGARLAGIGETLSVGLSAPLVAFGVASVKAAHESEIAISQVNAALASMGPVAGKTSEDLQKAAAELQHLSTFDDDDILKSVTANMLTFGNVSGATFDRAQQAALNLSARLGQDLQSSAIQVGKALNDPIKGVTALGRVGVSFTEQQKAQIKAMAEAGDMAGAQGIILGELEKQYGGAAKALRDATPGAALTDSWNNFAETIGAKLEPSLKRVQDVLAGLLDRFNNLAPGTQSFIVAIGAAAAALGPLLIGVGAIASGVGALLPIFAPIIALVGEAGLAGALGAAATAAAPFVAAGAAAYAIWALFGDKIGPVLQTLGEQFQQVLGPKLTSLFDTVSASLTELWNGPFGQAIRAVISVIGEFGAAYAKVFGEVLLRSLSALVSGIESAFKIVGDIFRAIAALLRGDFSGAWNAVKQLVADVVNGWIAVLNSLAPEAVAAVSALVRGIQDWVGNKLSAIWEAAKQKIHDLGDKFKWLWDVVVGHSYIPDMVDAIGENMARLDALMVKPATAAADKTGEAFRDLAGRVSGVLDRLFPLQAQLRSVMQDIADLDAMKAAGKLDPSVYDQAKAKLDAQAIDLQNQINPVTLTAADWPTGQMGDLVAAIGELPRVASKAEIAIREYGEAIGDHIMGGLRDVLTGRTSLGDMLKDLFSNFLYRLTTDALKNIETAIFGDKGLGGFLGDVLSGVLTGKAIGGPVMANHPYIVGEKRPELFVPSTAGRIVPNLNGLGRGTGGDGALEVRVTKSNLFEVEVARIADGRVSSGIGSYDRNVGSRVKDNMNRRG